MIRLAPSLAVGVLALSLALAVAGSAGSAVQEDPSAQSATTEEPPLVVNMEVIEDGLRALRGDLGDLGKLELRLDLLVGMQTAAKATKTMVPPLLDQQPEAERGAFLRAYRKEIITLEEELLRLERAILDGNLEAAKASYKALKQLEEDGHARFTEDG